MTTISASVRLRPTRIGFLVRPDDMLAVRHVMQICTCLWGGVYNPIIPVCTSLPNAWRDPPLPDLSGPQLANGYIKFFEPDVFVETQPGLMEELGLQQGQLEYGEPRTIPISVFSERGADSQPHPYGTGIIHVYRKLYEQEFRFVSRDGDRVASMSTNGPDGGFIDAVLGGFPSAGGLSTLSKNYIDAFKPTEFSPSAAGFLQILQEGFRFPLYFTRHQLKRDYPSAGKDGPTLFVVDPDNPLDLIDFWNIRLYQPSVMPLSTRWLHQSQEFIAHFLKDGYRPLPGNSYGVMITPTIQFARSISKERAATLVDVAGLHAIEGCEWHFKLWYDRIWDDHTSDLVAQSEPVRVTASEADHELPITGEPELSIRFPDLSPDFVPQYERGSARWVNVLQLKSYGNDDRLALAFPSTFDERKSRRFRLGDASFISREGFVLPQRYPRAQN